MQNEWIYDRFKRCVGARYQGVEKTIYAWGADPDTPVTRGTLRYRHSIGMTVEAALTVAQGAIPQKSKVGMGKKPAKVDASSVIRMRWV